MNQCLDFGFSFVVTDKIERVFSVQTRLDLNMHETCDMQHVAACRDEQSGLAIGAAGDEAWIDIPRV